MIGDLDPKVFKKFPLRFCENALESPLKKGSFGEIMVFQNSSGKIPDRLTLWMVLKPLNRIDSKFSLDRLENQRPGVHLQP